MLLPSNGDQIILVTGCAGFIGYYVCKQLLESNYKVIGVDNINSYYDVSLKHTRLDDLSKYENFIFYKRDISIKEDVLAIFETYQPTIIIHLAAQAGVRYSLTNPDAYIQSNILGFHNIIEACRIYRTRVKHLIYASSSSVYGESEKVPFEEKDVVNQPVSLYAATKISNEIMGYTYSHLYKIPATGLRFFTVYGPLGRPDMSYFQFTNQLFNGKSIKIFNDGDFERDLYRDFTYIDDVVEGIIKLIDHPPKAHVPHKIYNIGNSNPVKLMDFIKKLEEAISKVMGKKMVFKKEYEPINMGDVRGTYASTQLLQDAINYAPTTTIEEGLEKFAHWYVSYYKKNSLDN